MSDKITVSMHLSNELNHMMADKVCRFLQVKYNESFTALRIGDRLNTDHAKLFIKPENGDTLFTAYLYREDGNVTDDYLKMTIANKVSKEIISELKAAGIEAFIKSQVFCHNCEEDTDIKVSVKDFAKKYSLDKIRFTLILNSSSLDKEKIENNVIKVIKNIQSKYKFIFSGNIYILNSGSYEECYKDIEDFPTISNAWMDRYERNGKSEFYFSSDVVKPDETEIINHLMG